MTGCFCILRNCSDRPTSSIYQLCGRGFSLNRRLRRSCELNSGHRIRSPETNGGVAGLKAYLLVLMSAMGRNGTSTEVARVPELCRAYAHHRADRGSRAYRPALRFASVFVPLRAVASGSVCHPSTAQKSFSFALSCHTFLVFKLTRLGSAGDYFTNSPTGSGLAFFKDSPPPYTDSPQPKSSYLTGSKAPKKNRS